MMRKTRPLLICGLIACPLFIFAFLVEETIRINYDPLRHPISSLSIGDQGWMQKMNFLITGILLFCFSLGLKKALPPIHKKSPEPSLIIGLAAGLIGAGIFTTDPVYGFPQDQPLRISQFTLEGHLHDLFSLLVFICLPAACFAFRKRFKIIGNQDWATYSTFTGIGVILFFILTAAGFKQVAGLRDVAGMLQRLTIIIGFTWLTLLAIHLLRDKQMFKSA